MQSWALSERVEAIAGPVEAPTARRFHNPLADGPTPPFPAYPAEPVGTPIDAPPAFVASPVETELDPNDPIALLAGRPMPGRDAVPEFAPYGDRTLVRVLAAL